MARYIRDVFTGEYRWIEDEPGVKFSLPKQAERRAFQIIPDIQPYRSPIDGAVVSGRVQHRDHMRKHDVVELGNEKPKPHKVVEMPKAAPAIAEELKRRGIIG